MPPLKKAGHGVTAADTKPVTDKTAIKNTVDNNIDDLLASFYE